MEILYECYLLLWRAKQQNRECATDYAGISITECLHIIGTITAEYSSGDDDYSDYDDEYKGYDDANYGDLVDNDEGNFVTIISNSQTRESGTDKQSRNRKRF